MTAPPTIHARLTAPGAPDLLVRGLDPVADFAAAEEVYRRGADYFDLEKGEPFDAGVVREFFAGCPPTHASTDKSPLGVFGPDGRPVGVVDLLRGYPEPTDWYLGLLMFVPEARGAGYGARVMRFLVAEAAARGVRRLLVCPLEDNPRARAFWAREGFLLRREIPPMRLGNRVHRRFELYRPLEVARSDVGPAPRRAPARFAVLGNSGSGKSTLAAWLARTTGAAALDLDLVAWEPGKIAVPRAPDVAAAEVRAFCDRHASFVVEGCYAALVGAALDGDTTLVFLDPGVEACLAFCRARPHEPHKYASAAEQDERLAFLLEWVRGYDARDDDLSRRAHERLFAGYTGPKFRWNSPLSFAPLDARLEALVGPHAFGATASDAEGTA